MSLTRYRPLNIRDQFQRELSQFFNAGTDNDNNIVTSDWSPSVDVKETDTDYQLIADIPGVDPKDIEVNAENGVLTIKGERKTETTDEKTDYKRVERSYGAFYRRFSLPDTADAEHISAKSEHGVLAITIPKQAKVQARKIEVQH